MSKYDASITGWMTIKELEILGRMASEVPENGLIVEIGSLFGRSSVCLALSAHPTVEIHCIDRFIENCHITHGFDDTVCRASNWPLHNSRYNMREEFRKNTSKYPNIKMIIGHAPNNLSNYVIPDNINMFFMDSAHTNPNDWDILSVFVPRIVNGGILSGHDYNPVFPDVIENVHRLEKILNTKVTVATGTSIWYMTINNRVTKL